jgi:hypothetical protein
VNGYLLAGFGLGVLLVLTHVGLSLRDRVEPAMSAAIGLMVSGLGVVTGIRIVIICLTAHSLGPFHGEDQVYLAFGGIAVLWISVSSAWKLMWE